MVSCYGFSLLRNGQKYDYPFLESLSSLCAVTEKVFLALGDNVDETEEALRNAPFFQKLHIVRTEWDENLRSGGLILSQQTNIALEALRKAIQDPNAWGIYLQADEVLDARQRNLIYQDIEKAHSQNVEAVRFRYWHFWQSHRKVAIGPRWYPDETRAIRLHGTLDLCSYGDAQSFRPRLQADGHFTKPVYFTEAQVFHFGHVRDERAYTNKKNDFHRWWHKDSEIGGLLRRAKSKDKAEKTLNFWGALPPIMESRILRLEPGAWTPPSHNQNLKITTDRGLSSEVIKRIDAKSIENLENSDQKGVTDLRLHTLPIWKKFYLDCKIPKKMESKLARPWTDETRFILAASREGIGFRE